MGINVVERRDGSVVVTDLGLICKRNVKEVSFF